MQEKGMLVETIECTDPRARSRMTMLRLEWGLLTVVVVLALLIILLTGAGGRISSTVFGAMLLVFLPIETMTFLLVADHYNAYTEPIRIYSNGVESFSSLLNRARGTDGFLHKSLLAGVELRRVSVDPRTRTDYDRSITLELKNGKRRLIGIRPPEKAMDVARTISLLWELPMSEAPLRSRRT